MSSGPRLPLMPLQVLRLLPEYVGGQTSSHSQPGSCADEALEVELFSILIWMFLWMWRTPINKKSLHLYSNLESPQSFHSRCFSLLKGTRGGRFNFLKGVVKTQDESEVRVGLKPEPNAFHAAYQLPPAPNPQAPTLLPLWLPQFKMTPVFPSCLTPTPHSPGPIRWMNSASLLWPLNNQ